MSDEAEVICRTYTHARRHPKVVGIIGGWRSPWPSTNAQMGVLLGTAIVLVKTRPLWGLVVPAPLQFLIVVGLPIAGWWAVRFARVEGREPARAALGALNYATRPRGGSVDGRPAPSRSRSSSGRACYFSTGP